MSRTGAWPSCWGYHRGLRAALPGGTAVYQFAATAIGMLLALLLVVTPMIFLSGMFTPAESMAAMLYQLMALSPLRQYVDLRRPCCSVTRLPWLCGAS